MERALSAYSSHDAEALGALFAEDAVIRMGELEFKGRQAVIELWTRWFEAFPDVSSELERVVVEPSRFWLEWTERGTHRARLSLDGLDLPPRGGSLAWRGVSIYEVLDGETARVDYYVDRLRLAEQLARPAAVGLKLWRGLSRAKAAMRSWLRR